MAARIWTRSIVMSPDRSWGRHRGAARFSVTGKQRASARSRFGAQHWWLVSLVAFVPGCLDPLIEDPGATGAGDGAPVLPGTPLPGQTSAPGTPAIPVTPGTAPVTTGVAPTPVTPPGTPPASPSSDVGSEDIPGVIGDAGATFEADSGWDNVEDTLEDTVEAETTAPFEADGGADTGVVP